MRQERRFDEERARSIREEAQRRLEEERREEEAVRGAQRAS